MRITKDTITLESKDDRQTLWDAMYHYHLYMYEMSQSEHFAKDDFYKDACHIGSDVLDPMYKAWDDIVH